MLMMGATAGSSLPGLSATIVYPGAEQKPVNVNGFTWNDCLFPEGSSSGNEVHVQDGGDVIKGSVFGNDPSLAGVDAMNNTVVIEGGKADGVGCFVYGGFSDTGNATGNTVAVSGGDFHQVNGGGSYRGEVIGNKVIVTDGNMFGVSGGSSSGEGRAIGNAVTVSGGYIDQGIVGGYSDKGDAIDNSVTISGGVIKYSNVAGGAANYYGNAAGNRVTFPVAILGPALAAETLPMAKPVEIPSSFREGPLEGMCTVAVPAPLHWTPSIVTRQEIPSPSLMAASNRVFMVAGLTAVIQQVILSLFQVER